MNEPTNARAMLGRLIDAYETVALCEFFLALDENRPEAERKKSQDAGQRARARMLELDKEMRDG